VRSKPSAKTKSSSAIKMRIGVSCVVGVLALQWARF
jgi:hypothetical protein